MKFILGLTMLLVATQSYAGAKGEFLMAQGKYNDHHNSPKGRAITLIYEMGFKLGEIRSVDIDDVSRTSLNGETEYIVYISDDLVACQAILTKPLTTAKETAKCFVK